MVAKGCLFPFLPTALPEKENPQDPTLEKKRKKKKNLLQFSLSITLCVLALAGLCVCYFREPENQLCEERGYDQADVFMMS